MTEIKAPVSKEPNYTKLMEVDMQYAYEHLSNRDMVDALAELYGKTPRSIIAKLSNMGIYKAPLRTTKAGKPIVKKETLVKEIMTRLGVEAPSLVKANKQDLERLVDVVRNLETVNE